MTKPRVKSKIFKCGEEENFIFLESGAIIMQFTGKTQETTFPLPRIFLPDFIYREAADPITSSSVVKSHARRKNPSSYLVLKEGHEEFRQFIR